MSRDPHGKYPLVCATALRIQRAHLKIASAFFVIIIAATTSAIAEEDSDLRASLEALPQTVPSKQIKRVSIVPVDKAAQGGDVMIEYSDGSTNRVSTSARGQAAQLAPDGQTFGFALVDYYVDSKGDLWIATKALVLYRQGKRVSAIEPDKQAVVGWGFRSGSSNIMISATGTHGPTYLSLWDVATGKKLSESASYDDPKPRWAQGVPLLFCCTVKTTVSSYRQ